MSLDESGNYCEDNYQQPQARGIIIGIGGSEDCNIYPTQLLHCKNVLEVKLV